MARSPAANRPSCRLFMFLLFFVAILFVSASNAKSADPGSNALQDEQSELICHTENPDECYPRVFQPTDEFQLVHDDQQLPNGLHVRLNIWTGKKEAKINVPDENDPALDGLPVDSAVVLVDQEQAHEPQQLPIRKGAPAYEPVGVVRPPADEDPSFYSSLKQLKKRAAADEAGFDGALEILEDMSHDMYHGLKIMEDNDAVKSLFCTMLRKASPVEDDAVPRQQQAGAIIDGALQNNPKALEKVTGLWSDLMSSTCDGRKSSPTIHNLFYSSFVSAGSPSNVAANETRLIANRAKTRVSALSSLLRSPVVREDFFASGGMRGLLEILLQEDAAWATAQKKVALLLLDNFLDERMGAVLGEWPKVAAAENPVVCKNGGDSQTDEQCWDYHVGRLMARFKGEEGHWSKELHDKLREARKASMGDTNEKENTRPEKEL